MWHPHRSNINLSKPFTIEPNNELQYFTWYLAWHCLSFAKFRPVDCFNRWDSTKSNPICPFSWPTTLTSNKSAHSKLHEMYSQGNILPKSTQTTSWNWYHMFRNQLQPIPSILQSVKLKFLSKDKLFQWIRRQWICVIICTILKKQETNHNFVQPMNL